MAVCVRDRGERLAPADVPDLLLRCAVHVGFHTYEPAVQRPGEVRDGVHDRLDAFGHGVLLTLVGYLDLVCFVTTTKTDGGQGR